MAAETQGEVRWRGRNGARPVGSRSPSLASMDAAPGAQPTAGEPAAKAASPATGAWSGRAWNTLVALLTVAFFVRFALINEPSEVVFDEVHFGGFASHYLRREYFFDVHPPLGKLVIAGAGLLFGYDGGFPFANIGDTYVGTSAPYVALRTTMVALNVATIGLAYATVLDMGYGIIGAAAAAVLLVFDNALTVQSRFILLDSIMLLFIVGALFAWVRFRAQRESPFGTQWWAWLAATGAAIGAATATKMVGLFTVATIGAATVADLWDLAARRRGLSNRTLGAHFCARALLLAALPAALYVASYWVHFAVLTRTGPGDAFMSPEFQAGLEGSTLHARARTVRYGQAVRLKSRLEDMFLHSHEHRYPRLHDDGKVSSEGQQVTGYPVADANNLWRLVPVSALRFFEASSDGLAGDGAEHSSGIESAGQSMGNGGDVSESQTTPNGERVESSDQPIRGAHADEPWDASNELVSAGAPVRDGDEVALVHVQTRRVLYTHDVASPLTRTNMEVTAIAPGDAADRAALGWRVEVKTGAGPGGELRAHACHVRLVNARHGVVLTNWQQPLPKWGFGQREVNGDKRSLAENTRWIVWDVDAPLNAADKAALADAPRARLGFWAKFAELQAAQVRANATLSDRHPFRSDPASWPFVLRGVSYWDRAKTMRIYLLGNPVAWYLSLAGLIACGGVMFAQRWGAHRGTLAFISDASLARLETRLGFLALAWLLHYAPFFTMARTLYLHHYLPAYVMSAMVAGGMAGLVASHARRPRAARLFLCLLAAAVAATFFYFAPVTYGTRVPTEDLAPKRWLSSWDFP